MSMEYQVQENCLTIFLPREVDHHNAEEVKKSADAIIEKEHIKYVIFDFEQTDFYGQFGDWSDHGTVSHDLSDWRRGVGSTCQCQNPKDPDNVRSDKNHADI